MPRFSKFSILSLAAVAAFVLTLPALAGEWTGWRGPHQNGVSDETGLPASWSRDGENLIWRADFEGRSSVIVFDGRACAIGRLGEDIERQERVTCWNAENGTLLWQKSYTVYQTDVPWNRVGWSNLVADAETGYVFMHTVHGVFEALDRHGKSVWRHQLAEDYGRLSGYGGRTQTPTVDQDRVYLGTVSSNWGDQRAPRHRYMAFDKHSGEILWVATPGGPPAGDLNTQTTPVVAVIGGQRLLITASADGGVHALEARTGRKVWSFQLSQRGLNISVAVEGDTVFASHSEENLDSGVMGRLVAIDATGRGDVTKTHERWRIDELQSGFPSPMVHDGKVYVVDNSANLHAIDATSGRELWAQNFGNVGKSSPVWADGKIYLTEVNGNIIILEEDEDGAKILDQEHLEVPGGRYAEIYASPSVAYGRIYFATEEGVYCLGDKAKPFVASSSPAIDLGEAPATDDAKASQLLLVPAELVIDAGQSMTFKVRAYDDGGRFLRQVDGGEWSLSGVDGKLAKGQLEIAASAPNQGGTVAVTVGELKAQARVRVTGKLPWTEDFEQLADGQRPNHWRPTFKAAAVKTLEDGNKVLAQPKAARGAPRAFIYLGSSHQRGYTIEVDVLGAKQGRRVTDLGITNSGYTLDLQGAAQSLVVRSWRAERRMMQKIDFPWQMGVWYTLKLRVDLQADGQGGHLAIVRGKAWKRDQQEPEDWNLTAEDPRPVAAGSPGLYTYAPVESYFDNIRVYDSP